MACQWKTLRALGIARTASAVDGLPAPIRGRSRPGDALLHHGEFVHESGPNRSDHARLGLLMVFRAAHAQPDPELKRRYAEAQRA